MTTNTLQCITIAINSIFVFSVTDGLKLLQLVGWTVYVLSVHPSKPGTDNTASPTAGTNVGMRQMFWGHRTNLTIAAQLLVAAVPHWHTKNIQPARLCKRVQLHVDTKEMVACRAG